MPQPEARSRVAIVISAVLHLLLIYALLRVTAQVMPPTNSPIGEAFRLALGGGGGGGSGGASFAAPPPPPQATEIPPPPLVTPPEVVPPPPTPVAETPPAMAFRDTTPTSGVQSAPGTGGGTGGGVGTGTGPGTGSGVGPGSGSGTGGGNGNGRGGSPPEPRQMILPALDAPKSLRGKTVEVNLTIDALGKVSDIKIEPPISDRGYAKKFEEVMRNYGFRPARDSLGRAVAASYIITITLGN